MTVSKLNQELIKFWQENENKNIIRRCGFIYDAMSEYYGIVRNSQKGAIGSIVAAKTLEQIGQDYGLTRERIRQIIFKGSSHIEKSINSPYKTLKDVFLSDLKDNELISLKKVLENPFFEDFKNNNKGLLAILGHAGIKQVMYRNDYYLHIKNYSNEKIIRMIQDANKHNRHQKTLEHAQLMSKTVTYVPEYIRNNLIKISDEQEKKLNGLYKEILNSFIKEKPYLHHASFFSKKESWRVPKMKKAWVQVGLYIDKELFEQCEENAEKANTSVMNFIGCAFAWYSLKSSK